MAGEGGATKMRESLMKDMLVAGQTTVRVFRRTCCLLAEQRPVLSEGYVGGCRRGDDKKLATKGLPALSERRGGVDDGRLTTEGLPALRC